MISGLPLSAGSGFGRIPTTDIPTQRVICEGSQV